MRLHHVVMLLVCCLFPWNPIEHPYKVRSRQFLSRGMSVYDVTVTALEYAQRGTIKDYFMTISPDGSVPPVLSIQFEDSDGYDEFVISDLRIRYRQDRIPLSHDVPIIASQ